MSEILETNEWIKRAYITANELVKSEYIKSVVLLEYSLEYFYYVLETEKDMEFLYSRLELSYSQELYNILFAFSYVNCKDKLNYVKAKIAVENANEAGEEIDAAYKYLILDPKMEIAAYQQGGQKELADESYQLVQDVLLIQLVESQN